MQAIAEVFLPHSAEKEIGIPVPDPLYNMLANRVATLDKSVGKLDRTLEALSRNTQPLAGAIGKIETALEWQEKFLKYAIAAAGLWLAGLTVYGITLISRVSALEGKGGSYQSTVKSLQGSTSAKDVTANLDLLAGQVQKQAISSKPPSDTELKQIGTVVSDTAKKYPELPAVWDTASRIVNTRFDLSKQSTPSGLPNCWDAPPRPDLGELFRREGRPIEDNVTLGNCELTLDADDNFFKSEFFLYNPPPVMLAPDSAHIHLFVHDAVVTYKGTELIPFSTLICRNCIFRLAQPAATPPPRGQQVMRQLLTADLDTVHLDTVSGL